MKKDYNRYCHSLLRIEEVPFLFVFVCRPSALSNIQRAHYLDTLANGCSKGFMFLFLTAGSFFMQRMENRLFIDLLAGDAYCDRYTSLFTELLSVYGTAAVVIIGQNAEHGSCHLIHDYVRRLYRRSLLVFLLIAVIALAFAPALIRVLAGDGATSEAIHAGILQMRIIVVSYPFLTALVMLRYTLQVMGDYRAMPLLGLVEMSVNILMALLIPRMGYMAVCLGPVLSRIAAASAAVLRYRRFMRRQAAMRPPAPASESINRKDAIDG